MFSQRKGIKSIKEMIQVDFMDDDLRTGLWNALTIVCWNRVNGPWLSGTTDMNVLCHILWQDYFKYPIDTLEDFWATTHKEIRDYFFKCRWYEVYDFVEFIARNYPDALSSEPVVDRLTGISNGILKRELSAYRFVDRTITQITSEEEISEVEEALEETGSSTAVTHHLGRALSLLTDRKAPDYANSIKESISAVEAACNLISNTSNATLGKALNDLEKANTVEIHSALRVAFSKLYGYTSDAEGIRHALLEESSLDFEDAKFMLVSCSAFVNYLKAKAAKAGIEL